MYYQTITVTEKLQAASLDWSVVPADLWRDLLAAARLLDSEGLGEALGRLRSLDAPLDDALQKLAGKFQYDRIAELCEEALGRKRTMQCRVISSQMGR